MNLNELQSLNIRELNELAQKLSIDGGVAGLNKQELIVKILETHAKKDNSFSARGVLEVMQDGYGFLRSPDYNYMPGPIKITFFLLIFELINWYASFVHFEIFPSVNLLLDLP